MSTIKFGCQLPQDVANFDIVVEAARKCESLGFDSVWLYDHLSPFWSHSEGALECWTTLAAIAARTSRVKVGSLVTNATLRNPALLAKMSSCLDNISDGRLILGLGSGDKMSRKELQAYGYPFHSLDERVERLKESILIIKGMWRESPFSFQGKYYKITRAVNLPKPKQSPHPPIWVGGKHPKILNVIAELADGWNSWGLGRGTLKRRNAYLSEKCNQFNRDPNLIVRSWLGTFEQITQNLKEEAQDLVNQTKYFIVSFDSSTTPKSYQSFVDLMNSLA